MPMALRFNFGQEAKFLLAVVESHFQFPFSVLKRLFLKRSFQNKGKYSIYVRMK